uniref:GHMP family kinase ATP-binding protein n=1 Tax=Rheinheimera sp. TaxID=1869214 RepID=UPI004048CE4B
MVICRTPLRISFFGGGTDYPVWYREHGGAVISATINKYSYITARWLPPYFDYKHRIRYFQQEQAQTLDEIKHPSVRECARYLKIQGGLEIVHNADVPAQSGLGSSSTFTVGMLHALYTLQNRMPTKRQLALEAIHVEQDLIGEAVGSQDQTAAAFGGINLIRFDGNREIDVDPIVLSQERLQRLQENLVLVFTGFSRSASEIAKVQIAATQRKANELMSMKALCDQAFDYLSNPRSSLDEVGRLLDNQWRIKKSLSERISTPAIDELYDLGLRNGALGGKLLGAGGGGFMLFYAPRECQASLKAALTHKLIVPFYFDFTGSKVIYFSHQ